MRSIFYTLIAALAITHGAMAYDGYNIPCSYGGGGNCICDVGSCQDYSWNDSPETFMCGSAKGDSGKCSCVDAQYNKTIEFPCGCTSDSGVYGTTATGSTARTNCYIETGTTFSDTSGSGRWDGRSYWCN